MGFRAPLLLLGTLLAVAGCSGTENIEAAPSERNLTWIGEAYANYGARFRRPPRSAEQLKPFLKKHGNPEEILKSPENQQPYEIIWGVSLEQEGLPGVGDDLEEDATSKILVCEQQNDTGKRYVLFTDGSVQQLDEAEFAATPKARGRR